MYIYTSVSYLLYRWINMLFDYYNWHFDLYHKVNMHYKFTMLRLAYFLITFTHDNFHLQTAFSMYKNPILLKFIVGGMEILGVRSSGLVSVLTFTNLARFLHLINYVYISNGKKVMTLKSINFMENFSYRFSGNNFMKLIW